MNRLEILNTLQMVEIQIEENRQARRDLQARLADDSALAGAKNALEASKRQTFDQRARLRTLELEADGLEERVKGIDARLYGGHVSNAKELSNLEQEGAMLKRQKSELEDRMLELMAAIEGAEANVQARNGEFERISNERSILVTHARAGLQELENEMEKLLALRDQYRAQIAPADLQVYDILAAEKKQHPVARLKGTVCNTCGFQVPSGLASRTRMGELAFCANCGRILVP